MSRALSKKDASAQSLQQAQSQSAQDVETHEKTARASGEAGLNLNLFGALGGAFSSKSKKTTHTNKDGSSHAVEDRLDQGAAQGYAQGQGAAYAKGDAVNGEKHQRRKGVEQAQSREQKKVQKVDHLGIES